MLELRSAVAATMVAHKDATDETERKATDPEQNAAACKLILDVTDLKHITDTKTGQPGLLNRTLTIQLIEYNLL